MVENQAREHLSFREALEKKYNNDENFAELDHIDFSGSPKENGKLQ